MGARADALLWVRAGVVSAMTFLVGAVGHVSGGGLLPSWPALASMLAIGTPLCAVVLARRASTRRIVAFVVVGQTACHSAFSLSSGHAGDVPAASQGARWATLPVGQGERVGSLQDHYEAAIGTPTASSALTVPDPSALLEHLPMFLAHTIVAILVGLWLAAGERALRAVLTMVFAAVVALCVAPAPVSLVARPAVVRRRRPATPPSLARVSRCVVRRGPPALLAV